MAAGLWLVGVSPGGGHQATLYGCFNGWGSGVSSQLWPITSCWSLSVPPAVPQHNRNRKSALNGLEKHWSPTKLKISEVTLKMQWWTPFYFKLRCCATLSIHFIFVWLHNGIIFPGNGFSLPNLGTSADKHSICCLQVSLCVCINIFLLLQLFFVNFQLKQNSKQFSCSGEMLCHFLSLSEALIGTQGDFSVSLSVSQSVRHKTLWASLSFVRQL